MKRQVCFGKADKSGKFNFPADHEHDFVKTKENKKKKQNLFR